MMVKFAFDILPINEPKIHDLIPDSEVFTCGYNIIRKDCIRNGGSVVLYFPEVIYSEGNDLTPDR